MSTYLFREKKDEHVHLSVSLPSVVLWDFLDEPLNEKLEMTWT